MTDRKALGAKDLEWCVLLVRYRKIGKNQWVKSPPVIDVYDEPWPQAYSTPQIRRVEANRLEIRVRNDRAVDLDARSLLGDYRDAVECCDRALLQEFPRDVIMENLVEWEY